MKVYKEDLVADADKEQLAALLAAGWETEAPAKKEAEAPAPAPETPAPEADTHADEHAKKIAKRDLGK